MLGFFRTRSNNRRAAPVGVAAPFLSTDFRHLGDIAQPSKHGLAASQLFDDFFGPNWL